MVAGRPTTFALGLMGPFRLQRASGERIEIPSKKGIALIAMLAMAEDGERTRGFLQDKLWSRRQHAEGRGSLRRELSNLRKLLNQDAAPLLLFDRDRVRLCVELMDIDARRLAVDATMTARGEFMEGLDIAGEEGFEDWLREQRGQLARRRNVQAQTQVQVETRPSKPGIDAEPTLPAHINDLSQTPSGFDGHPALAVLPFVNLSGDTEFDYFAEGISEELIERLSRIRWLPVIARSSSFSVRADDQRAVISSKLGAKYLLDGRVRRNSNAFALSIELSDTASARTIWSQRFPLDTSRSFEALDGILAETVVHLDSRIDYAEQIQARARRPAQPNVDYLIWRGRWHLNRLTAADSDMAQKLFAEALDLDPDSPEALIQSTFALGWSIWAGRLSNDRILQMRKLAQRAIQADPDDGRGYMLAGISEMWLRHPLAAQALLQQAIALNPSLALAHAQLGGSFNLAGQPTEAIVHLRAALRLSANDQTLFYTLGELALAFDMLGQWSDAIEHADHSLARRPAYWYAHVIKIDALVRSGDVATASAAYKEMLVVKPGFSASYLEWLPFVDRSLIDKLAESLKRVSGEGTDELNHDDKGSIGVAP